MKLGTFKNALAMYYWKTHVIGLLIFGEILCFFLFFFSASIDWLCIKQNLVSRTSTRRGCGRTFCSTSPLPPRWTLVWRCEIQTLSRSLTPSFKTPDTRRVLLNLQPGWTWTSNAASSLLEPLIILLHSPPWRCNRRQTEARTLETNSVCTVQTQQTQGAAEKERSDDCQCLYVPLRL